VDRDWLEAQLAAGRSYESIAREAGRHPSTVAYWARKHGLSSAYGPIHAPRGGIDSAVLAELVTSGASIRDMAKALGRSTASVRHWLRSYGLETQRMARMRLAREPLPSDAHPELGRCPVHGVTPFVVDRDACRRCRRCRVDGVARRRRRLRELLVAEAGGACTICGFDGHPAALQFHHLDRTEKSFTIRNGDTRSLERMRRETSKCVLLCANCHAQVEAGALSLPVRSSGDGRLSWVAQSDGPG
jgi:transposase-like protein